VRRPILRQVLLLFAVSAATGLVGWALAAAPASALRESKAQPVIFVHGVDLVGNPNVDCADTFGKMRRKFRDYGRTGKFDSVKYYEYDSHCDHDMSHYGRHSRHFSSGHYADGDHGAQTNIRHLGYHLAWYIWRRYTSRGRAVDVVAHSMGGLIIRYAVAQVQRDAKRFPRRLKVSDAITLGTPHGGARWAVVNCGLEECDQMRAGSDFLVWLQNNAWEPDGTGGTDWTAMGSDDDNWVAADRAVGTSRDRQMDLYFGACHKVWYRSSANIEHSDYMNDMGSRADDDVYRSSPDHCGTPLKGDLTYWHPVKRAYQAISFLDR